MTEAQDYGPRITDLEMKMEVLKVEVAGVKSDLVVMEKAATEHRAKEEAMLTKISDRVESISREQLLEKGRREGEEKTKGAVGIWARAWMPALMAAGTTLLVLFIKDQAPPPPPTIVVSPPPTVEVTPPAATGKGIMR